ncbi:MAG: response regulator [bacterium]
MSITIFSMEIHSERDVVLVRQRAGQIAGALGFRDLDQTHISAAASEIARNALIHGGGGKAAYLIEGRAPQMFLMRISDQGPGIIDVQAALEGRCVKGTDERYVKGAEGTEKGMGILRARRLVEYFHIESGPGRGTIVLLGNPLPAGAPLVTGDNLTRIALILAEKTPEDPFAATIRQQHRELLRTLDELRRRQDELACVNRELEDTNRGIMALYAELEEKAEHLRRSDQLKSRFLSDMSHEFRTPIKSILALGQILLDRTDGDLTGEQEKQLNFIIKAAQGLLTLINDLLDLGRIEAGKTTLNLNKFEAADLFGGIRGIIRPLLVNEAVDLIFEDPVDIPALYTDEGKVSQILRNFLSNALKFTEAGEVRVSAGYNDVDRSVTFSVADTGIGIASEDQERIFEEFIQLPNPLQRTRGTGLGLSLSRKLAAMLGGTITLKSQPGKGSTFSLTIPAVHGELARQIPREVEKQQQRIDLTRYPVLVIEDDPTTLYTYEKFLAGSGFQLIPATGLAEARQSLKQVRPMAVILDILLPDECGWCFLAELKENEATWDIPVLIVSNVNDPQKGMVLGAEDYCVKPVRRQWLLNKLRLLESRMPMDKVLIIDDQEISRYLLKGLLADTRYRVIEATGGQEGLRLAASEQPQVIFLDLIMPEMDGFEVLDRLKADPATRDIPVIIVTAKDLEEEDRKRLAQGALDIISKGVPRNEAIDRIRETLLKVLQSKEPGGNTSSNNV